MTRAKRFALYGSILSTLYVLVFLNIVPVPLVEEETAAQLIPVVRTNKTNSLTNRSQFILDSVVDARFIWFILALVAGMGPLHISGLLRSL